MRGKVIPINMGKLSQMTIGYIYFMIWQLLPISINKYIETVMIMFFAGVTAYIAGKIISSPYIVNVLEKLHICDTGNYYIWQDLIDKEHSVKATITYEKKIYSGKVHLIENYNNAPHIVLCLYTVKNNKGRIIEDLTGNYN